MRVLFFLNQYNAFNYDTWPYFQKTFYYTKLYNTFSVWFNRFIQLWFWELSRFCCKSMIRSNNVPRKERRSLSGIACKLGLPCVWMVKSVFSIVHPLCEDWRIEKSAIRLLNSFQTLLRLKYFQFSLVVPCFGRLFTIRYFALIIR